LEAKEAVTLKEYEARQQLKIAYKLADRSKVSFGEKTAISFKDENPMNETCQKYENEILELKNRIQILEQENTIFGEQAQQLQVLAQEKSNFKLQIVEKDGQINSTQEHNQLLKQENKTSQHRLNESDRKINFLKIENRSLKDEKTSLGQQLSTKDSEIRAFEIEKRASHLIFIQQNDSINALKQEKQSLEQDKKHRIDEMERLKVTSANTEQLLTSKDDAMASLKRENQTLCATNERNQQETNEVVETFKSLLDAKTNEYDLLKQNMEHLLMNEKRKNDVLEKENRTLKQYVAQQQRPSQITNVLNDTVSHINFELTCDDPDNDINYDTEFCDTEESGDDDINYDTPDEDKDNKNDLNYDSDSQMHNKPINNA
jgi:chromosome segregation ATPase